MNNIQTIQLTSLVMAVKDNLEWTRKGIESILTNTDGRFELIIIDNGSQEETRKYLQQLSTVRLIRNEENLGCARAWNQGIQAAQGDFIGIVNNDIEVPRGWLSRLQDFYMSHSFALVSPAMREGELISPIEEYQQLLDRRLKGRYFSGEFRGIALFAASKVFEQYGGFDNRFRGGKFEDEDFFFRLVSQGEQAAVTTTVVFHHYGSKTILSLKNQAKTFEEHNRKIFWQNWRKRYFWRKWRKWQLSLRHWWVKKRWGCLY